MNTDVFFFIPRMSYFKKYVKTKIWWMIGHKDMTLFRDKVNFCFYLYSDAGEKINVHLSGTHLYK